jgi:TolB-like protein
MQIWSAEIKELESLYISIKGSFPELEKDLENLIKTDDANVVLLYARRCLEIIVTDLCEHELQRPRKTEPLKGIIDKLHREEKVPGHIITSMESLNSLSAYGTHPKVFDPEQVRPILLNLATIIKWYVKYKETVSFIKQKSEEPAEKSKEFVNDRTGIHKTKRNVILLISGLVLVIAIVIVALFVFDIIGAEKGTRETDKSIAVLPFVNDSEDKENTYFINGIMEEVLLNLQAIKDLRVPGRTSVEQYRDGSKSIPEIAKELGVNYIVEGSGQKYGNTFRLRIQLLDGKKDRHLWGESYEQPIESPEDIFGIQSRIAQSVAAELKAIITPEEKQLIDKTPTLNLTAYDLYQRGREEQQKFWSDNNNREALEKAGDFFHKALEYDSTFARAYSGLANVYWDKHYWETFFSENFLDSVLILTDIALSYDDKLSDAYLLRGSCYQEAGKTEQAEKEYDKAIKFNPNDWMPYYYKADLYGYDEIIKLLDNAYKAVSLYHGSQLSEILEYIRNAYGLAGFPEKVNYYAGEILKMNADSAEYFATLAGIEQDLGNYENGIEYLNKAYMKDSGNTGYIINLANAYMYAGHYKESLRYYKKYIEISKTSGQLVLWLSHRIGYVYWQNGYKKEAEAYFDKQIEYDRNEIRLGRLRSEQLFSYYDLAGVYAFRGEKEKALENLRQFNQRKIMHGWMVWLIKNDPLFDSIRDEPEFQKIVSDMESKYQAEHERVQKWLEEQGS